MLHQGTIIFWKQHSQKTYEAYASIITFLLSRQMHLIRDIIPFINGTNKNKAKFILHF